MLQKRIKSLALYFGVLVLFCLISFCGCANVSRICQFQAEDKIHVVTTIYPVQDFANRVAGNQAEIINLVPAGMEPHDFELSAAQMQLLEDADIFIYNGAGMEPFVEKTMESITNKDLIIVNASQNVSMIHSHHVHGDEKERDEEEHLDPHTWLGIENAKLEVDAIAEGFCKYDTEMKEVYQQNAQAYKQELDELKDLYSKELAEVANRKIVVAHEAFGYLCEEQGLEQEAIEGLTADSEPDSARMKEIIEYCKSNKIKVIFFEELVSPKVANAIATEIGAKTDVLNPIEGRTAKQEEQGLTYIDLMKENLSALKNALSE